MHSMMMCKEKKAWLNPRLNSMIIDEGLTIENSEINIANDNILLNDNDNPLPENPRGYINLTMNKLNVYIPFYNIKQITEKIEENDIELISITQHKRSESMSSSTTSTSISSLTSSSSSIDIPEPLIISDDIRKEDVVIRDGYKTDESSENSFEQIN